MADLAALAVVAALGPAADHRASDPIGRWVVPAQHSPCNPYIRSDCEPVEPVEPDGGEDRGS